MKRRAVITGVSAAAALGGLALLRPRDRGAPHDDYFTELDALLQRDGPGHTCLVLDLDRLNHNLIALRDTLPPGKAYRLVAKSLPCIPLIEQILSVMGSRRIMAFHQPFTTLLAKEFPDADLLLGKPMPVQAAARFYDTLPDTAFDPQAQLQWLIDTPQRLQEYLELARGRGLRMRINIEIDVGLHRGGIASEENLVKMLSILRNGSRWLRFAGFMGYDPHVVKLPRMLGTPEDLQQKANAIYHGFIDTLREHGGDLLAREQQPLVFNGAGSPNFRLHDERSPTNDLGIGSTLVKPSDFDLPLLEPFTPALFIAAPVLKVLPGVRRPGIEWSAAPIRLWNRNHARNHFIYGGYWKAQPVSPPGLAIDPLFGRSSNQELLTGSARTALEPGSHVFLHPTQSESVMLQFGPIVLLQAGAIIGTWDPFSLSSS